LPTCPSIVFHPQTITSVGEDVVGIQNGSATLENSLAVSKKTKYKYTIQPSNSAPTIYPREMSVCPDEEWQANVHISIIIHKSQKVEITQMSINV